MLSEIDQKLLQVAYDEAKAGFLEGGCPIGSVLARNGEILAQGRNQRVQKGDPIAHGDCLLYTSPSPRDGLLSRMPSSA